MDHRPPRLPPLSFGPGTVVIDGVGYEVRDDCDITGHLIDGETQFEVRRAGTSMRFWVRTPADLVEAGVIRAKSDLYFQASGHG